MYCSPFFTWFCHPVCAQANTSVSSLPSQQTGRLEKDFYSPLGAYLPFAIPGNRGHLAGEYITRNKAARQVRSKEGCESYIPACLTALMHPGQYKIRSKVYL